MIINFSIDTDIFNQIIENPKDLTKQFEHKRFLDYWTKYGNFYHDDKILNNIKDNLNKLPNNDTKKGGK